MNPTELKTKLPRRSLLAGAALLVATQPAWAIFGVWRRAARRTVFVAGAATAAAATTAAVRSRTPRPTRRLPPNPLPPRAAKQAEAAAAQAKASQTKTPQQKLAELQSLYDQKLISASDYEAAKTKILNQMTQ